MKLRTKNVELSSGRPQKWSTENLEGRTQSVGLQSFLVLRSNF